MKGTRTPKPSSLLIESEISFIRHLDARYSRKLRDIFLKKEDVDRSGNYFGIESLFDSLAFSNIVFYIHTNHLRFDKKKYFSFTEDLMPISLIFNTKDGSVFGFLASMGELDSRILIMDNDLITIIKMSRIHWNSIEDYPI